MHKPLPGNIRAGDSIAHTYECGDYPASDGWTHSVQLRGPSTLTLSPTGNASLFTVSRTSAQTADYAPGTYVYVLLATRGDERKTVDTGLIEVLPDLATIASPVETRSHARRMLDAIEARLEGRITADTQALSIRGRSIQQVPISELVVMRDKYRAEVRREDAAAGISAPARRITVRFAR